MNLTPHQIALLREASQYSLMEDCGKYYRLGGHGFSPLRVVVRARQNLQREGYLVLGSIIKTSDKGKEFLLSQPDTV